MTVPNKRSDPVYIGRGGDIRREMTRVQTCRVDGPLVVRNLVARVPKPPYSTPKTLWDPVNLTDGVKEVNGQVE